MFDNWQKVGADGKVTTAPMSENDIKRFTQLVRESIGLKDDRGDQLNVINQAFKTEGPIPADREPAAVADPLGDRSSRNRASVRCWCCSWRFSSCGL